MKTKIYTLILFATILILSACTSSDDEMEMQGIQKNELDQFELERVPFMLQVLNSNLNDNTLFKSENNGNGVYIVPFYSDNLNGSIWYAEFPIYDKNQNLTQVLVIDFPQNGEDRALVFSESEMMANFISNDPRMFIFDIGTGKITYSNWCDENRSGLYKGRVKTEYIPIDQNNNGIVDFYWWGPNTRPTTAVDKNFIFHIKATLSNTHAFSGDCPEPDKSVNISYTYQGQNGKIRQTFDMR